MKTISLFLVCEIMVGCATVKDNTTLQQLAEEDQADRIQGVTAMSVHDVQHQQEVRRLIAARQVRTGAD